MDLRYKLNRIRRWTSAFGLFEALRFEVAWSCRSQLAHVNVPGYEMPFLLRRWSSDLSVFEAVFLEREFELYDPLEPGLIIDGGANVGFSTAFYANRFPNAKVVAIEPSDENVSLLRINCQALENVKVVEGGLWPVSGFLRISNPDAPAWSFRCELTEENTPGAFPAFSVDDIIDTAGFQRCDLLKLDIEGAEEWLFRDSKNWLSRVNAILVEVHGADALAAINAACPEDQWERSECGEKLLLLPRLTELSEQCSKKPADYH